MAARVPLGDGQAVGSETLGLGVEETRFWGKHRNI